MHAHHHRAERRSPAPRQAPRRRRPDDAPRGHRARPSSASLGARRGAAHAVRPSLANRARNAATGSTARRPGRALRRHGRSFVIALDTNILVYARREETPQHQVARTLLTELAEGGQPWVLAWPCIYEFLRVVTHPRV